MSENNLTPEQKLDEIYTLLQKQESREKRRTFFRVLKLMIILGIVYFITANPAFLQGIFTAFVGTTMDTIKPMILEQTKTILSNQSESYQSGTLEKIQEILKQIPAQ